MSKQRKTYSAELKARIALEAIKGQMDGQSDRSTLRCACESGHAVEAASARPTAADFLSSAGPGGAG